MATASCQVEDMEVTSLNTVNHLTLNRTPKSVAYAKVMTATMINTGNDASQRPPINK